MGTKKDYEREIGSMAEQIKNLKNTTDRIEDKLDKFIDSADKKYATKEEVCAIRDENKEQNKEIQWTKSKIVDLTIKLANVLALIGLGGKALNLY